MGENLCVIVFAVRNSYIGVSGEPRAHISHAHKPAILRSNALTLMKRDHNNLFSVCLMGCEQNVCIWVVPSGGVYRQTEAGLDSHKWAKLKRRAVSAVLNQPSETAALQNASRQTCEQKNATRTHTQIVYTFTQINTRLETHTLLYGHQYYPHLQNTFTELTNRAVYSCNHH